VNKQTISPNGRLVRTLTPDRLELEGFLVEPEGPNSDTAVLFIHGMFENFHLPLFVDPLASAIAGIGATFVSVNTRARDYHYYHRRWDDNGFKWELTGGSYEIFANCLSDLDGWIEFSANELGASKVVLAGHSHGALKAAFYAATKPDSAVSGVALLGPSDDVGMQRKSLGNRYDEALTLARELVANDKGDEMMPSWAFGDRLSGAMYVDMFNQSSDLGLFSFSEDNPTNPILGNVRVPTLITFGADDLATSVMDSESAAKRCGELLSSVPDFSHEIVEGADHHYVGRETELVETVAEWVAAL